MADATGKDGVATEHIQEAELTESPENAAADARGSAADSTISGVLGLCAWLRAWLRAWAAGAKHATCLKMGDAVKI